MFCSLSSPDVFTLDNHFQSPGILIQTTTACDDMDTCNLDALNHVLRLVINEDESLCRLPYLNLGRMFVASLSALPKWETTPASLD